MTDKSAWERMRADAAIAMHPNSFGKVDALMRDPKFLPYPDAEERNAIRERVRAAVGAALERVPELAHIRMIGPIVDMVANAACDAAGLPALRMEGDKR
jgi:hypothetical protein